MNDSSAHPPASGRHPAHRRPHRPAGPSAPAPAARLTAEEINRLPVAAYRGPIHLVRTPAELQAAHQALRRETLLGFDIETRPAFRKGESYPPSLLQLAGEKAVYLFQLQKVGLAPELAALLANPHILKAGVALTRDLRDLRALREFQPAGFVELGTLAAARGIPHNGLRGLAAAVLGCRISKSAQLTNWAQPDLPPRALEYAATDAWIGRQLYLALAPQPAPAAKAGAAAPLWRRIYRVITRKIG